MPKKQKSFADKLKKFERSGSVCPVCEQEFVVVKQVKSVPAESGAWKFNQNIIKVCKCNEAEVYAL
ncbi:hypothetical protein BMS3Bbin03_00471 [bacterium BMS3Bbin03]|nr:hypothetical protein BMS3Bbin03_00471 [bacterium BMS3Bbin03]